MGTFIKTAIVTEPTLEPLTLSEVKLALSIEDTNKDSELDGLIQESRRYVENMTGRKLITQTWNMYLNGFLDVIDVPYAPLQSVSSITYNDSSNVSQTLSSAYYIVDTSSEPGQIISAYSYSYPDTYSNVNAVTIKFVCGYGDNVEDVPERFKRAMKLYIRWMFDDDQLAKDAMDAILVAERVTWL